MLSGSKNKRKVKEGKANVLVAMVFVVSSWTGLRIGSGPILVLVLVGPCPSQTLVLFCCSARCSSSGCQLLCSVATSHHSGSPEGSSAGSLEGSSTGSLEGSSAGSSEDSPAGCLPESSTGSLADSSAGTLADSSEGSSAAISEAWLWF